MTSCQRLLLVPFRDLYQSCCRLTLLVATVVGLYSTLYWIGQQTFLSYMCFESRISICFIIAYIGRVSCGRDINLSSPACFGGQPPPSHLFLRPTSNLPTNQSKYCVNCIILLFASVGYSTDTQRESGAAFVLF